MFLVGWYPNTSPPTLYNPHDNETPGWMMTSWMDDRLWMDDDVMMRTSWMDDVMSWMDDDVMSWMDDRLWWVVMHDDEEEEDADDVREEGGEGGKKETQ